jgi:hypothetical protein
MLIRELRSQATWRLRSVSSQSYAARNFCERRISQARLRRAIALVAVGVPSMRSGWVSLQRARYALRSSDLVAERCAPSNSYKPWEFVTSALSNAESERRGD